LRRSLACLSVMVQTRGWAGVWKVESVGVAAAAWAGAGQRICSAFHAIPNAAMRATVVVVIAIAVVLFLMSNISFGCWCLYLR